MATLQFINILNPSSIEEKFDIERLLNGVSAGNLFNYTLVTVGHQRLNPWVLSQFGMAQNKDFSPLIALNPAYHHPVEVAQKIVSLFAFYPNSIAVNLVTGSFFREMSSINEKLDLASKQKRLIEFYEILTSLVTIGELDSFSGEFYKIQGVKIHLPEKRPIKIFVSGQFSEVLSSDNTYYVKNIKPLSELEMAPTARSAVAFGICARSSSREAERALEENWPVTRQGEMMFKLSLNNGNTSWNKWLTKYLEKNPVNTPEFTLSPLMRFQSSSPFIVGSYEEVAETICKIIEKGYFTFLLDFKSTDLPHIELILNKIKNKCLRI